LPADKTIPQRIPEGAESSNVVLSMTASNLTLLLASQSLGRYFSKFAVLLPQPQHFFINPIWMSLSVTWVTDALFFVDYERYFEGGRNSASWVSQEGEL
jgi:hypothetical protein